MFLAWVMVVPPVVSVQRGEASLGWKMSSTLDMLRLCPCDLQEDVWDQSPGQRSGVKIRGSQRVGGAWKPDSRCHHSGEDMQWNREWTKEGTLTLTKGVENEKPVREMKKEQLGRLEKNQDSVVPQKPREERVQERGSGSGWHSWGR